MTKEDKELLLKDLCARLPYGVIVHNEEGYEGHLSSINQTIFGIELGVNITSLHRVDFQLDTCKSYLCPMSSMTDEERSDLESLLPPSLSFSSTTNDELVIYTDTEYDNDHDFSNFVDILDWLNAHHFDYRGLIGKGLALEVTEGMYKTE